MAKIKFLLALYVLVFCACKTRTFDMEFKSGEDWVSDLTITEPAIYTTINGQLQPTFEEDFLELKMHFLTRDSRLSTAHRKIGLMNHNFELVSAQTDPVENGYLTTIRLKSVRTNLNSFTWRGYLLYLRDTIVELSLVDIFESPVKIQFRMAPQDLINEIYSKDFNDISDVKIALGM